MMTEPERDDASEGWEQAEARHRDSKRASWRMAIGTVLVLLMAMAAFALTVEMDWYGFRPRVLLLLVLGMIGSAALAAGLMAAVFHSHRSGLDEESGLLPPSARWEADGDEDDARPGPF